MSEYDFGGGYEGDPSGLGENVQGGQGPKWFRDYMDKVSGQLTDLKAENDRLKTAQRQTEVADTLKAKGYAPAGAALYSGEANGLDDWLKSHGAALAKLPAPQGEEIEEQPPSGPPASTVSAEDQNQMARMQEAGTSGAANPQGTEAELVARLQSASKEEFANIMRAQGNAYDWS